MENLQLETFEPLLGDTFRVTPTFGEEPFDAVLSAVEPTPYGDPSTYNGRKVPFSLLFVTESGEHVPQQICTFAHADAGDTDLFVVPIGPQGSAMRYEAVIS